MGAKMTVVGRVGRDADLRNAGGSDVLAFSIATTSPFGEKRTSWWSVSLFGKRARSLQPHVKKGQLVEVTGSAEIRPYKTSGGEDRTSVDINAYDVQLHGGGNGNGGGGESSDDEDDDFAGIF